MSKAFRYFAVVVALGAISAAYRQGDKPADTQATTDATIYASLRDVINRGADVYNSGDHAGCYRIFEGALISVKPLLAHRPQQQEVITKALASAEADPVVWRRAFTLRAALDKVRAELNPKKGKGEDKTPPLDKEKGKEKDKDEKDKDKDQAPKDRDKDPGKDKPADKDADKDKKDKDEKKDRDKDKQDDKDKGEKDKDKGEKDKDKPKDDKDKKEKKEDLSAERLPPPLREEEGQGKKDT